MSLESYEAVQELLSKLDTDGYRVKLPAEGVYPKEVIEPDEDGMVLVKPMTGEDEQLLSNIEGLETGRSLMTLLKRRVVGCKKPEELYDVDVEFLIAAIKAITFSSEYDVRYKCVGCDELIDTTVDSNNFECRPYTTEDLVKSVDLKNGQVVKYTYLPHQQELRLLDNETALFKQRILSVDNIEDKHAIEKWLEALKFPLYRELRTKINTSLGGFDTTNIKSSCPKCGAENRVGVNPYDGFLSAVLLATN